MNSLVYHAALLIEALTKRLNRLDARTVLQALAIGVPLLLLIFVTVRYSESVARLTLAILGAGGVALALAVITVVAAGAALLYLRKGASAKRAERAGDAGAQA